MSERTQTPAKTTAATPKRPAGPKPEPAGSAILEDPAFKAAGYDKQTERLSVPPPSQAPAPTPQPGPAALQARIAHLRAQQAETLTLVGRLRGSASLTTGVEGAAKLAAQGVLEACRAAEAKFAVFQRAEGVEQFERFAKDHLKPYADDLARYAIDAIPLAGKLLARLYGKVRRHVGSSAANAAVADAQEATSLIGEITSDARLGLWQAALEGTGSVVFEVGLLTGKARGFAEGGASTADGIEGRVQWQRGELAKPGGPGEGGLAVLEAAAAAELADTKAAVVELDRLLAAIDTALARAASLPAQILAVADRELQAVKDEWLRYQTTKPGDTSPLQIRARLGKDHAFSVAMSHGWEVAPGEAMVQLRLTSIARPGGLTDQMQQHATAHSLSHLIATGQRCDLHLASRGKEAVVRIADGQVAPPSDGAAVHALAYQALGLGPDERSGPYRPPRNASVAFPQEAERAAAMVDRVVSHLSSQPLGASFSPVKIDAV